MAQIRFSPLIDQPGTYQLLLTNTQNGCVNDAELSVQQDIVSPVLNVANPGILTCQTTQISLSGLNSSDGPDFSISWNTSNGNILDGADGLSPSVDQPGDYTLVIQNVINECVDSLTVNVQQDVEPPFIQINNPEVLNCILLDQNLDATNSSSGAAFAYSWTTPDGNILEGENGAEPLVDLPGTYNLVISDLTNGCQSFDSVLVQQDIELPFVLIAEPDALNCDILEVTLDPAGSSMGPDFEYTWETTNGKHHWR